MHIVVTGGTGFIGAALSEQLANQGHRVTLLTRDTNRAWRRLGNLCDYVEWDGVTPGTWETSFEQADAVVNLAGASIADERWTESRKRYLIESRVSATRLLVQALGRRASRPVVLISGSGVGYYGTGDDRLLDERSERGSGCLAELSDAWEAEACRAEALGVRVIRLRIGMVLERNGGALPRMLLPFKLFAGGPVAPGTQWVSWIHRQDLIGLIQWAMTNHTVSGPLNAVAPGAVTMAEFCRVLGRVMGRPSWLQVPGFAVRLALGEMASLLTTGQRVTPMVALSSGFPFVHPDLESALHAILTGRTGAGPPVPDRRQSEVSA
jgi:uncharacterized protein (TIGR01777 family)